MDVLYNTPTLKQEEIETMMFPIHPVVADYMGQYDFVNDLRDEQTDVNWDDMEDTIRYESERLDHEAAMMYELMGFDLPPVEAGYMKVSFL